MMTEIPVLLNWAFEHSSDGMLITDLKGVIRMVNDAFVTMFGYPREEAVGQRTGFLRSQYSTQQFYEEMWRSLKQRNEWKGEIINRTKGGMEKTCFLTITAIKNDEGEHIGFHGVEIDLTERKRLEAQVIQGEKLAAIGESVATLVHEIRNPLNGIAMNIYMLRQAAESGTNEDCHWSDEERESIQLIATEVRRLDGLVKNVLTYARNVELHYERVVLDTFMQEVEDLLVDRAEQSGVHLMVTHAAEGLTGRFDPDQMKQVMLNLVQNAIEAAEQSDARLVRVGTNRAEGADWQSISSSGKVLLLSVANTGAAISEETRKHLFRPFFTTKSQGLGLGLATSAKIVRQHHGIVDVQPANEPPYSTLFTIALPA
ncbi:MAG TPA: PAS domain S-box protein [Candidatus Kapabacteria bacterium]|nr:PAS domain S-box protein [Candidatus Kapabacteria bacterium]